MKGRLATASEDGGPSGAKKYALLSNEHTCFEVLKGVDSPGEEDCLLGYKALTYDIA